MVDSESRTSLAVLVEAATYRYGALTAIEDVSLQVAAGEFFGLLGPNGAGKTTLIQILCTLLAPQSGTVRVAGFDARSNSLAVRGQIGVVFQQATIDPGLTAAENLWFAGKLYGLNNETITQRTKELLALFELTETQRRPAGTLSGGQFRALDVARALMHNPGLLILDEPTVSLDLPNRRRIWHYLRLLREQARTTILLSTHLLEEAEDCDRVAFMKKGHLIASGAPSAMIADLGKEVIEIHSPTPEALAAELDDWFAEYRVDTSAVLCARPLRDDVSANVLKASCRAPISEVTYRPANLNDVFLWLNAPRP